MFNFKNIISSSFSIAFVSLLSDIAIADIASISKQSEQGQSKPTNSRYEQLVQVLFDEPYAKLPRYKVSKSLFQGKGKDAENYLLNDAKRTLESKADLLPEDRGQKLLQANGICFAGEWLIDQESEFSGLFSKGARSPAIARASVSFSGTQRKERRALGLAVKLLPNDLGDKPSLNIVTLHSVGGLKTPYLYELSLDNEPPLGRIPRFRDISTALKLKSIFLDADKQAGSLEPSVTYRSVESVAAYGQVELGHKTIAPKWLRFSPASSSRVDRNDFRDELRVGHYPNQQLKYTIAVASGEVSSKSKAQWQAIGELIFNASVTSKACDTRLHFAHPKN